MATDNKDATSKGLLRRTSGILGNLLSSPRTQTAAISALFFGAGLLCLLLGAVGVYSAFYAAYIPPLLQDQPMYLSYDSSGKLPPSALIDLQASTASLMPDQIYALAVKLHVPDSTHNFGLGNFMVSLALLSEKNVTLVEASRPALLNYKSPLQRTLLTLWRMVPLVLFNRGTETQTLVVQLIEGFQDSEKDKVKWARVTLSTPNLHVYSTKLSIQTSLRGLRFFMHEWYFLTGLFMTLIIFLWEILLLYYAWLFVRSLDLGLSPATDKENAKGTRRRRNTMRDDAHIEEEGEELARDETTLGDFEDADPEDLLLSSLGRETSGSATGRTTSPLPSSPPLHSEWPSFVPVSGPETMLGRTIARKASKGTLRLRRPRSSIALPGGFHARVPSGSKSGPSFPPSEVLDDAEEVNGGEAYAVPFDTAPPTEVLDTGLPTADSTTEHHEHLLLHLEKIESVNYWRESLPTAVEGEETPLAEHVHAATLASSLDPGLGTDDTVLSPPESATTSHHPDELMEKKDESMLEPTLAVLDSVDLEIATTGKDGAMRHRHTKKQKQQNQNTGDGTKKEEEVAPEDITIPSLDEASDDTELTPSE